MASGLQIFTSFLLVSIFYALAVTLIVPTLPNAHTQQVVMFQRDNVINITTLASSMKSGVTGQTNVPLLDFGALIFYSSNIVLNLMLNFFTAIPQMVTILFSIFFSLILVDSTMALAFTTLFQAIVAIIYMIAVLSFIMGSRTAIGSGNVK